MTEQIGVALPFTAFYTTLGIGQTGLTVTVDVYRNGTEIVTAGSATEAGDGLYTYTLASGSNTVVGIYIAVFKTATTTVDQQHLVAGWEVGTGGIENLDATISSRLPTASYTTPPTVGQIDTQLSNTHGAGSWLSGSGGGGTGALTCTLNVTVSALPVDGVDTWVSTDSAGTNIVARGYTNALGNVTFYLDAGTYYWFKSLSGYTFTNPETITVS